MEDFMNGNRLLQNVSELSFNVPSDSTTLLSRACRAQSPFQNESVGLRYDKPRNQTRAPNHTIPQVHKSSERKESQLPTVVSDDFQFDTEIREQQLVRRIVKAGMTVFDIGAHIGKYTRLFSILVGYEGKVYAFEPTESSFRKLASAVKQFGCTNVTLINKAVWVQNRKVTLNEFPEEYSVWNSLGLPEMKNPHDPKVTVPIERSVDVEAVTLDSFCQQNNIENIDYLKLDIEGSELEVLVGSSRLLENKAIRHLQFEISKPMLEGCKKKAKLVFDFLKSKKYECHTINDDGTIGSIVSDSDSYYENYIALPAEPSLAAPDSKPQGTDAQGQPWNHVMNSLPHKCKPTPCATNRVREAATNHINAPATMSTGAPAAASLLSRGFTDGDLWTPETYMRRAIMDWISQTSFEPRLALSVDKNPPLDEMFIQRWPGMSIERAVYPEFDAQDLSRIPENRYDLVYSNQILEHIPKPWIAAAEMVRVLKPGGIGLHTTCAFNPRHGPPVFNDYYRFLPDGLAELFDGVNVLIKAGWGNRQALLYNLGVDDGHGVLGGRRFCEQVGQRNEEQYPWHVWIIFEKLARHNR